MSGGTTEGVGLNYSVRGYQWYRTTKGGWCSKTETEVGGGGRGGVGGLPLRQTPSSGPGKHVSAYKIILDLYGGP